MWRTFGDRAVRIPCGGTMPTRPVPPTLARPIARLLT